MPALFKSLLSIILAVSPILVISKVVAMQHDGFDLSDALVDTELILAGGPAKDGIPAIDRPLFVSARHAVHVRDTDRILGIELDGVAKAYPVGILNWHEIVNDAINGEAFAITYCPLCGTGVAFSSEVDGNKLDFGVSGLLYNSDVLLYDRQSESLWSQIMSKAITGKYKGRELRRLPIIHTSWAAWKQSHPDTQVLSDNTGYDRDYRRNPYEGYAESSMIYFKVGNRSTRSLHPKERVLGLQVDDSYKAYPFSELDKSNMTEIPDRFAGKSFTVHWERVNQSARITDAAGKQVAAIEGFWFAWFAFHPETEVFAASK